MTIQIRPTGAGELRRAADVTAIALMSPPVSDEQWERSRPSWDEMPSQSAWDGDRCVGHAGLFLVDTTVPGGARLATGAIARVGVLPTHRRRGVGSGLMRSVIRDAAERGLVLASLRASEATIYGRFGFGVAGESCEAVLLPSRARPIVGAATDGSFRILEPDELIETVPALYDRVAHRRPGVITRPRSWWSRLLREAVDRSTATFVAVHTDAGGIDDGYLHYTVKWNEEASDGIGGNGRIHDLFGATDSTELALWAYVADVDLVTRWCMSARPSDDLVRRATWDIRSYRHESVEDEQWLRLIDVGAALAGRSYRATTESVTIGVHDPLLSHNDGAWLISAGGAEPTDAEPDLVAGIGALSAAYLGGPSWAQLAATADVEVRRAGSLEIADTLFASRQAPFCGTFF